MEVRAIRLGQKINIRELQSKLKFNFTFKDPFVIEYPKKKFVAIFRYGVVVFWGFENAAMNEFLPMLSPFIVDPLEHPDEEQVTVRLNKSRDEVRGNGIDLTDLNVNKVALISVILGRSIVLDYFEREVGKVLNEFGSLIQSFESRGTTSLSSRSLLKKVGVAMNIQHMTVSQMALLDKPDLTWDDHELNTFYNTLTEDYEIEDRYSILGQKLKILFQNVEFVFNFVEGRRSLTLEVIIVVLILMEIVMFMYEMWTK